ncbi:UNKNOWN [Stylonychia lemnae]|uniref:Uncharacterized protein n=1 Tax=Stylonychia lemnae TaxID=5949 RepID=A0A078A4A2_STYLE|nr:UNKNOWN [Stylonychia lemnae]|eukprot:CDW75589.1 UNKNOWN [Stylonychia lemnae]
MEDIILKTHISSSDNHQTKQLIQANKITVFQKEPPLHINDLRYQQEDQKNNDISGLLKTKKRISKALIAAKFTSDTRKTSKISDLRKQIKTARDINYKPLTGLSKELNFLAKEMENVQNNQTYSPPRIPYAHQRAHSVANLPEHNAGGNHIKSMFKDYNVGKEAMTQANLNYDMNRVKLSPSRNLSLTEKIDQKNKKLNAQLIQSSLQSKLKIVNKFEKSDVNHSKTMKEKKQKYHQHVVEEEERIKFAKAKMKNSLDEYRKVHEEREKRQQEIMEQKQEFKQTIIKSRSEYLKKKNEMALNMAKERYEMNNMLESEMKRSKNQTVQKSLKAKILHDQHISDIKNKAEIKNKSVTQRSNQVFMHKVSETEEFKNKIVQDRSNKEIRKEQIIMEVLEKDPSMYLWIQKGASGSRLRSTISENLQEDIESFKKRAIIRDQLKKDFGHENSLMKRSESQKHYKIVVKDEENFTELVAKNSTSLHNSISKKVSKKVRIKEPKIDSLEKNVSQNANKSDIKRLERIVDTDKYDFTNMGYSWDIINGYMGGEKINKKISYERALAMTQDSRILPFEIRKNFNKEKSLQLARKVSCKTQEQTHFSRKNGLTQLLVMQNKENEADIEARTNEMQLDTMKELMQNYAERDMKNKELNKDRIIISAQSSPRRRVNSKRSNITTSEQKRVSSRNSSPSKSQQVGQYVLEKAKKEDIQQKQDEQMKNVIRILARRSQNKAYRSYYEQIENEKALPKSFKSSPESVDLENARQQFFKDQAKSDLRRNYEQLINGSVGLKLITHKPANNNRKSICFAKIKNLKNAIKCQEIKGRREESESEYIGQTQVQVINYNQWKSNRSNFSQVASNIPLIALQKGKYSELQRQNLEKIQRKQQQSQELREYHLCKRKLKAQAASLPKFDFVQKEIEKKSLQKLIVQENKQKMIQEHLQQMRALQRDSKNQKLADKDVRRQKNLEQLLKVTVEESEQKQLKLSKKLQKIHEIEQHRIYLHSESQRLMGSIGSPQKSMLPALSKRNSLQHQQHHNHDYDLNGMDQYEVMSDRRSSL